jgi:hypothetical protein
MSRARAGAAEILDRGVPDLIPIVRGHHDAPAGGAEAVAGGRPKAVTSCPRPMSLGIAVLLDDPVGGADPYSGRGPQWQPLTTLRPSFSALAVP